MQRGSARGDQAKLAIILAAERLFAERGYRAVSMREIGAAAGQKNNSAAQYHFGSRRGLIEAILEYRMAPINDRRLAMLAEMASEGRSHDLRSLVEALVVPWIERSDHPTHWARFLSQVAFSPDLDLMAEFARPYTSAVRIVEEGILHAMDDLPPLVAFQRLLLVNRLIISAIADQERVEELAGRDGEGNPWRRSVPTDLIDLAVAMVKAPVSDATLHRVAELDGQSVASTAASTPTPTENASKQRVTDPGGERAVARPRSRPTTRKAVQ